MQRARGTRTLFLSQGWSVNLNGAGGIIAGCGKGIMRVLWSDARVELDLIPSEFVVNGIIAAGWKTGRGWTVDGQSGKLDIERKQKTKEKSKQGF